MLRTLTISAALAVVFWPVGALCAVAGIPLAVSTLVFAVPAGLPVACRVLDIA